MSARWTEGYHTGMQYSAGYYRELCPQHLRFCLLIRGIEPPPAAGVRYCELAMGLGCSANIHAAANDGDFTGMDFQPGYAALAAQLAREGGSGLRVTDESLAEFSARSHAPYDYLCLHGGWSWFSRTNREHVVKLARQALRPGGILYLSYYCWPGWSPGAPLRELFKLFDDFYGCPGLPPDERIRNAVALTAALLQRKPLFLNVSKWIEERFAGLKNEDPAYLAHEFFNASWHVAWFRDVAEQLAEAKLDFGASARIRDNLDDFGLTPDAAEFIRNLSHPVVREQVWDFFCNTQFRTDIFVKGARRLSAMRRRELLLNERFVLAVLPQEVHYSLECGMGIFALEEKVHGHIVELLAADQFRPKSLQELKDRIESRISWEQLAGAVARLAAKGYVQPCGPEPDRARVRRCHRLNSIIFGRENIFPFPNAAASPITGGSLKLLDGEGLLLARTHKDDDDCSGYAQDNVPIRHDSPLHNEAPPCASVTQCTGNEARMALLRAHGLLS